MGFLVLMPPLNGSKAAAAVPPVNNFACGNSESFFLVLTADDADLRVAKDLVTPGGREGRGESLHDATIRATMHSGEIVAEDAVVAEMRETWMCDDGV